MGRNSATGGHQIMGGVRQMLAMGASGHRLHEPGRGGRLDASPAGPSGDGINTVPGSLFAVVCGRSSAGKTTDAWTLRFARF